MTDRPVAPGARPYGNPIRTYVRPERMTELLNEHGVHVGQRLADREAALAIIDLKAQDPNADRDLLAVLHHLVSR